MKEEYGQNEKSLAIEFGNYIQDNIPEMEGALTYEMVTVFEEFLEFKRNKL